MGLFDVLNTTFLFQLAIVLFFVGILGLYIMQKINEQNHKINSMFELVSTLAGEINNPHRSFPLRQASFVSPQLSRETHNLITVTDDEYEDDEDEDDEDQDEDDEDQDEDQDEDDDYDDEDEENDEENFDEQIKSIHIGESIEDNYGSLHIEELVKPLHLEEKENNQQEEDEDIDFDDELDDLDLEDVEEIEYQNQNQEESNKKDLVNPLNLNDTSFLKTIHLTEDEKNLEILDYKKLTIQKLRSIAVEKGFVTDASKLKKGDILKLLEVE
jgi:hypothetical protein